MSGEKNLDTLLKSMTAVLHDGVFTFATLRSAPEAARIKAKMVFEEAEGTTLILLEEDATSLGIQSEFPCRMITLNVHSSLEAVGFIARVATALASAGMGVNPVSGYFHDHLFVPSGREQDALQIIAALRSEAEANS